MAQTAAQRRAAQRALARQQRAIRQGRAKPKPYEPYRLALARQRGMRVITQDESILVKGMTKAERSRNAKHANAVRKLLRFDPADLDTAEGRRRYEKLVRKIESYEGRNSGGDNPVEYASDPYALIEDYLADPESFQFEDIYEEIA